MVVTNMTKITSAATMGDREGGVWTNANSSSSSSGAGGGGGGGRLDNVFENPFDQTPVRITFIILYSVVFAMCFLGNIVVLIVFAYSKRMRTRTNLFLANLAVADFCVGVFCVLPNLSINLSLVWRLGRVMCKLYFFVNYLAYTASILLLVVIAAERYLAIMHPLRSRRYFTAARLFVAQAVVWVVAAMYNVPILLMFDTTSTPDGAFCYITLPLMNLTAYYTTHFVLWYLVPLTVILVMYGRISCTLWATSAMATTTPVTRHTSRTPSLRNANAMNTSQYHQSNNTMQTKCCPANGNGNVCVTYCDTIAHNGFHSVVTVGVLPPDGAGRMKRASSMTGPDLKKTDNGVVFGSKSRLSDAEDGKRPSRAGTPKLLGADSDRGSQRLLACIGDGKEQTDNGNIKTCSNCFTCVPKAGVPDCSPGSKYSQRLDYTDYVQNQLHQNNKRLARKHRSSDEYPYELSEVPSSEDYESYRGRGEGTHVDSGHGGEQGLESVGGTTRNGVAPRRLRRHCHISSPRGLTSRRRVIRLLVAVVTIFAFCVLPFHLRNLLHYWNVYDSPGGIFDFLSPISSVLMYLNCGLNPVIYWMFSDHFRRSLKDTICFWKRGRRNSSRMMLHSPRQLKNSLLKHDAM